jgi:hypothetical protein
MVAPPLLLGGLKLTVTWPTPGVELTAVGALGVVAGMTVFDAAEAALVPTPLMATTVQVTGVPLVSPVTVIGDVLLLALCAPQVAVYPVIAAPPLLAGAVKATVACALPPVAVPIVGAPGTVAGVTLFEAADAELVPMELLAVTVNV